MGLKKADFQINLTNVYERMDDSHKIKVLKHLSRISFYQLNLSDAMRGHDRNNRSPTFYVAIALVKVNKRKLWIQLGFNIINKLHHALELDKSTLSLT